METPPAQTYSGQSPHDPAQPQPAHEPSSEQVTTQPNEKAVDSSTQSPVPAAAPAHQPEAPTVPAQNAPPQSPYWESSLWGCFSPLSASFLACCLPCVIHGRTADRMRDPTMKTAETFNNDCLISLVLNCAIGCGWVWVMQQRARVREHYGIEGTTTRDCCVAYWCPCCATVQNYKEVVFRTKGLDTEGYQAQGGMQVKPAQ